MGKGKVMKVLSVNNHNCNSGYNCNNTKHATLKSARNAAILTAGVSVASTAITMATHPEQAKNIVQKCGGKLQYAKAYMVSLAVSCGFAAGLSAGLTSIINKVSHKAQNKKQ